MPTDANGHVEHDRSEAVRSVKFIFIHDDSITPGDRASSPNRPAYLRCSPTRWRSGEHLAETPEQPFLALTRKAGHEGKDVLFGPAAEHERGAVDRAAEQHQQLAIHPVHKATMARNQVAEVLDVVRALDP